jgi:hypothetical protein
MMQRSPSIATRWIGLAILFASSSAAAADCQAWQLLRTFNAVQANGFNVVFELDDVRNGRTSGTAHFFEGSELRRINGQADATFDGTTLTIDVRWTIRRNGHYEGRIENGKLAGVTKDLTLNPTGFQAKMNWVHWESRQTFKCAQEADDARCADYARTAVAQNKENVANRCGFTGARWYSTEEQDHKNWCMGVDAAMPVSEAAARAQDLSKCRQTTTINLQQKRRIDDVLMKPK